MSEHRPNIAVLASGSGTTANALAKGIYRGRCEAEISLVIASKASAGILEFVKKWNSELGFDTQALTIGNRTHPKGPRERGQSQESSEAICRALERTGADLVLQLGYMVIGNDPYVAEWGFVPERDSSVLDTKALNWHPGLLPLTADTYGENASALMLNAYCEGKIIEAEHTVHAVTYRVDEGPQFATHPVEILPDDTQETLFQRVQWVEKAITPYAVDQFINRQSDYINGNS